MREAGPPRETRRLGEIKVKQPGKLRLLLLGHASLREGGKVSLEDEVPNFQKMAYTTLADALFWIN